MRNLSLKFSDIWSSTKKVWRIEPWDIALIVSNLDEESKLSSTNVSTSDCPLNKESLSCFISWRDWWRTSIDLESMSVAVWWTGWVEFWRIDDDWFSSIILKGGERILLDESRLNPRLPSLDLFLIGSPPSIFRSKLDSMASVNDVIESIIESQSEVVLWNPNSRW